jgi:hypothetical protein
VNDTAEWSQVQLDLNFPASYTQGSEIKIYIWNKGKEFMVFDDAQLEIKADVLPSYQPVIKRSTNSSTEQDSLYYELQYLDYWYDLKPVVEYINADGDTITIHSAVYNFYTTFSSECMASALYAISFVLLNWVVGHVLYNKKIFIKI